MERKTKIMIATLAAIIVALIGLLIWQAMERAKWERAFSELNGTVLHEYIMNNPEVIMTSLKNHLGRDLSPNHGFMAPRPPKEYEASAKASGNVGEKIIDISF
ncbi:MAG: hypothetical protein ABJN42_21015 [Roseibium sp.]|uniref:hypothetical protein n=1 Tax=Roseibium sp. TaxID=1936156 RepID=UPI00329A61BC